MSCTCQKCGDKYKVDLIVSNQIWDIIRPDKSKPLDDGLLCGSCIMKSIEELDQYDKFDLVRIGSYLPKTIQDIIKKEIKQFLYENDIYSYSTIDSLSGIIIKRIIDNNFKNKQ